MNALSAAIAAYNSLRERLNRSPTDRLILGYAEFAELHRALCVAAANETEALRRERVEVQGMLPRNGLEILKGK